jgi:N-carbamoyl-L-amino-acid hydrolase
MALTLDQLNQASPDDATALLAGLYEHSPWIPRAALANRPFGSLAQLKHAMVQVLAAAGVEPQLALIRAHPELAGKAMVDKNLTAESTNEQSKAGLTHCTPQEFEKIQQLNAAYNARFGFPFILAVRGPRGTGLSKAEIIATFERRLQGHPDFERQECIRNIHRIAEIRLNDLFGVTPELGNRVWDWQERLAQHSDTGFAEQGQLTVTYLTDAHRACAQRICTDMLNAGCDTVHIDAVGNVVGHYKKDSNVSIPDAGSGHIYSKTLLTGSHYDTVRNGGKYDGRLGIYVPLACVQRTGTGRQDVCRSTWRSWPLPKKKASASRPRFLGSGALTGDFKSGMAGPGGCGWHHSMRAAMQQRRPVRGRHCGHPAQSARLPGLCRSAHRARSGAQRAGHSAGHRHLHQRLGALQGEVSGHGQPRRHHAHEPPPRCGSAVAELILHVEQRAMQDGDSVATVGLLQVPSMARSTWFLVAANSRWTCAHPT